MKVVMTSTFEVESTLTDRYQTTVPETVRRALKLGKRDKIHYVIRPDGAVMLTRAAQAREEDPLLGRFLEFLARDLRDHPHRLQALDARWLQRIEVLLGTLPVDLDAPLSADDE
jgi:antitoxin PrlF